MTRNSIQVAIYIFLVLLICTFIYTVGQVLIEVGIL